jgi:LacI family transcriptional regulator
MDKLEQIAEQVGVSANTVLRVLRGENKEVWPSAIRRAQQIRGLARQMGYMPNASARAMRRGRFNCVALLLSTDEGKSALPHGLLDSIHDALAERGIRLIVSKLPDAQLTSEDVVPSILREWSCDGLLINYTDRVPRQMPQLIERYHIPSIWINRRQETDCVYYDDVGGARVACDYLIRLGHRRITYLDFVHSVEGIHYSRRDRYLGYKEAMRTAGLEATAPGRYAGALVSQRLGMIVDLLRRDGRPTALLSYDAGERLLLAASQAGICVPEQVSLMSFGMNHAPTHTEAMGEAYIGRSVGIARVPSEKAGRAAVSMLLEKIARPQIKLSPTVVPLELEPGDTCGPAKAGGQYE